MTARIQDSTFGSHAYDFQPNPNDSTVTTALNGENLSELANRLGIDLGGLLASNPNLSDSAKLQGGQEVRLPPTSQTLSTGGAGPQLVNPVSSQSSGPSTLAASEAMAKTEVQMWLTGGFKHPGGAQPGTGVQYFYPPDGGVQPGGGNATKSITAVNDLEDAIRAGDVKKMEALVASGADVNGVGSDGKTPLMAAAEMGNTDAIEFLVQNHADPKVTGADGQTPLMAAAKTNQDQTTIDLLIQKGAEINKADKDGNTALMVAAGKGNRDSLNALLAQKTIDVNATRTTDGKTALIVAAENGDDQSIIALTQKGANADIRGFDKSTNQPTDTAMMALIRHANDRGQKLTFGVARALANASHTPAGLNAKDKDGKTAMMLAASFGFRNAVVALADAKADPDIQDPVTKRTAIMDLLSNVPADRPLSRSEAESLINASHDLNKTDHEGKTALMIAAGHGQNEMVTALLQSKKGVRADIEDNFHQTALMNMSSNPAEAGHDADYAQAAKLLIEASKKAAVLDKSVRGRTALMDAAIAHNADMIKALNQAGANLNLRDASGKTALMFAAAGGDKWSVRFLLDKDWKDEGKGILRTADASIQSTNHDTALSLAEATLQSQANTLTGEDKKNLEIVIDLLKNAPPPSPDVKPSPTPATPAKNSPLPDWKPRR